MNRILLVDDMPDNLDLLQALLESSGFQVERAVHGADALEKARRNPPDLVITDILMPVMDGFALCRQWKRDPRLMGVPLIIYSATYTEDRDREFALGLGAERYVVKPVAPEVLLRNVRELIDRSRSSSVAPGGPGQAAPAHVPADDSDGEEAGFLRQYNEALIHRLEAKMEQLQQANCELERSLGERDEAGARIQEAEERLRLQSSALEAAANAIMITDREGVIEWVNAAFTTFTGYSAAEAIGRSPGELIKSGKHDGALYRDMWETVLAGKVWYGEMINKRKDGSFYTEEMTITPLKNDQGEITRFIAVKQDITERKKLEAQYLRSQRMESIGTLASGIAHDLNNVLAPILMAVELLRLKFPDGETEELLATLETSAQRGSDLVRQVLSFARGMEGQRVMVNLIHLCKDVQKIVRDTFPKLIDFHCTAGRDLWPVKGDPTQLHQVLLNLCVNARDAMPEGGRLSIRMENRTLDDVYAGMNPTSKPGPYVVVQVADTGTGIPPEIRDRVFEPFFTSKKLGRGTGLGLSTSLAIVKSHGGWINLYSEVGKGATFTIYLPADTSGSAAESGALDQTNLPRGNGELVLVVDDEEGVRKIAQKTLEHFGYRVLLASHGAEALSLYARQQAEIAVVVTDMAMPVMDGPSTIVALKAMNPNVRIIGSSGLNASGREIKGAGGAIKHFLPKPYVAETLLKALDQVLRQP